MGAGTTTQIISLHPSYTGVQSSRLCGTRYAITSPGQVTLLSTGMTACLWHEKVHNPSRIGIMPCGARM